MFLVLRLLPKHPYVPLRGPTHLPSHPQNVPSRCREKFAMMDIRPTISLRADFPLPFSMPRSNAGKYRDFQTALRTPDSGFGRLRPISSLYSPFALRTSASVEVDFIGFSAREFDFENGRRKSHQTPSRSGKSQSLSLTSPVCQNCRTYLMYFLKSALVAASRLQLSQLMAGLSRASTMIWLSPAGSASKMTPMPCILLKISSSRRTPVPVLDISAATRSPKCAHEEFDTA